MIELSNDRALLPDFLMVCGKSMQKEISDFPTAMLILFISVLPSFLLPFLPSFLPNNSLNICVRKKNIANVNPYRALTTWAQSSLEFFKNFLPAGILHPKCIFLNCHSTGNTDKAAAEWHPSLLPESQEGDKWTVCVILRRIFIWEKKY